MTSTADAPNAALRSAHEALTRRAAAYDDALVASFEALDESARTDVRASLGLLPQPVGVDALAGPLAVLVGSPGRPGGPWAPVDVQVSGAVDGAALRATFPGC